MTMTMTNPLETFESLESEVRSYIRSWPTVFTEAEGSTLSDEDGREYIDFFAGAGALNYGHNDPAMRRLLLEYIAGGGVVHSLDMATVAKREFLETLNEVILQPRGMDYVVQFPGPTGTNAVESALKLARKVTGRDLVVGFTNAFHGMTLGSLSVTGNSMKRGGGGVPLNNAVAMPYDGFFGPDVDSLDYFEMFLSEDGSGVDKPAAVIVETLQGEGGIHVASFEFLQRLERLCREHEMLLIVDDVQMGCGRTGPFFSFEPAGITPDVVCLSKSLSGYGLPMAVTLFRRDLDEWEPGEHNGTFRGHNLAFVTATEALRRWRTDDLTRGVKTRAATMKLRLHEIAHRYPETEPTWRGRGLAQGLHLGREGLADEVCHQAFERGLILETSGAAGDVVKLMPPITIDEELLDRGLTILDQSFAAALGTTPALAGVSGNGTAG